MDRVQSAEGLINPADIVEIKASLVLEIIGPEDSAARVDFFIEEGGDE